MQRKKRQTNYAMAPQEVADDDKLVLVKAAAWAWHQHSSSSISKLQQGREIPSVTSRQRSLSHGPSRYRLESLSSTAPRPVAARSTPVALLDVYETERITRELERLVATSEKREGKKMVQKKKNKGGGGCLLGRHAVKICGSSANDLVAEIEPLVGRHHESSSKSDVLLQRRRPCKKL